MTIESSTTPQKTIFEEITSVEQLENFIKSTCNTESSYFDYLPSLSHLTDSLYESLEGIKHVAETNESLQDLSAKISSYIDQLCTFQIESTPPRENSEVINAVSETLTTFKKELEPPSSGTDLDDDDFEMLLPGHENIDTDETDKGECGSSIFYSLYDSTWDASRTASLRVYGYIFGQTVEDVIKKTDNIPDEYLYTIKSLIENLGGRLTTREVVDFLNALSCSKVYQDQAEFLGTALCNKHTIDNRKPSQLLKGYYKWPFVNDSIKKSGTPPVDFLFIPFVYKGSNLLDMLPYVDTGHIVLITVCFSTKTVEYYDSFAFPPESWTCYENFSMKEELDSIKKHCFGEECGEILTNNTKQQHDWHNCGVFVIWYIIQRMNNVLFEEITSKEITASDIESIRTDLAKILASPKKMNKKILLTR